MRLVDYEGPIGALGRALRDLTEEVKAIKDHLERESRSTVINYAPFVKRGFDSGPPETETYCETLASGEMIYLGTYRGPGYRGTMITIGADSDEICVTPDEALEIASELISLVNKVRKPGVPVYDFLDEGAGP